jgi:hypothetical protein
VKDQENGFYGFDLWIASRVASDRIFSMKGDTYHEGLTETLIKAQEQLFWDRRQSPPAIDSTRFMLKVMEMGTWDMVVALESAFPKTRLVDALESASCGSLSPRSWNFWCLRLGVDVPYPHRFAAREIAS